MSFAFTFPQSYNLSMGRIDSNRGRDGLGLAMVVDAVLVVDV